MSEHSAKPQKATNAILIAILALAAAYFGAQFGFSPFSVDPPTEQAAEAAAEHSQQAPAAAEEARPAEAEPIVMPSVWSVIPFVALLLAIALLPLFRATEHWWESNRNRLVVALVCAAATIVYYLFFYEGGGPAVTRHVVEHAILAEYIPFIVLLFSLYVISGGIRIEGDLLATPGTNAAFLSVGAMLASFVGTTGAAMLLIRPLIETNNERKHLQHTVVFFIFIVCNCGGCLLPIGDPPLFLGYLKGVAFLWTLWNLWLPWLLVNVLLVGLYYFVDRVFFYPKESLDSLARDDQARRPLRVRGMWPNAVLLALVIGSIALLNPAKPFPGTSWHPWVYLREIVQILLVGASLAFTAERIRTENRFNYHAILEVAALFVGIFICMQPPLEILHHRGGSLGLDTPTEMFWATGSLSGVLDNAPTYVVFFQTAAADPRFVDYDFAELVSGTDPLGRTASHLLMGISLGAVFLGAMTYIGNGPNFMVRAIAEEAGVKMPSFLGYVVRYSLPILIPVFFIVSYLVL